MKTIFKIPVLLLSIMLVISCGEKKKTVAEVVEESSVEEVANKNNESDKEAICNLVKEQNKLFNDIIEAAYQDINNPNYWSVDDGGTASDDIGHIEKEIKRLKIKSDKYLKVRDGRNEGDIKAYVQTMMNCQEFNQELHINQLVEAPNGSYYYSFEEEFLSAYRHLCQYFEGDDWPNPARCDAFA